MSASLPIDSGVPVANRGMVTVSIMLATLMQALDTTIANVALPHMQGSLSASQDEITWVLTSYIVAAAIAMPLTGWLCARFGRKRIFLWSVAGFTVSSALCGLALSLPEIVLARLLQGVFGAALVPLSQAVLLDINPRERHGQAMAVWGMGIMLGPILGPVLGGWLTDNYGWRWVFYINLPVGIIAFLGILAFVQETRKADQKLDFFGFCTLGIAIGALQLLLDRGETKDWFSSPEIWIYATLTLLGLTLFVAHTATVRGASFLDRALLKDRNFVTGLFFIFLVGLILYATMALLPQMLENLMDYPVVATGLVTAPRGIGTMIAMMIVGPLIGRIDIRLIMAGGFGLTALSLAQMAGYTLTIGMSSVVWPGIIQGLGLGFIFVPLTTAAFSTLESHLRTEGTTIYSLVRNIGSSFGISIVQTLLTENTQVAHSSLVQHINVYNPFIRAPYLPSPYGLHSSAGLAALNAEITRQAGMIAYIDDFKLMMIVALLAMPFLLLIRVPKHAHAGESVVME
jgi:DHA2 family multidrug resistance protein